MPIRFPCHHCNRNLEAKDQQAGRTLNCPNPVCQKLVTVPTAEAIALNKELSEIEAVVNESERMIESISLDMIVRQLQNIPDPDRLIAKSQEWLDRLMGQCDKLNTTRLKELKWQNQGDSRISQLGYRAAKCVIALYETALLTGERLATPDFRPTLQSNTQTMMRNLEIMLSDLL